MQTRPNPNEYAENFEAYVSLVPEGDLLEILRQQAEETVHLLKDLTDEQSLFRYGQDKWTIKEVIGHMADTERVMAYRLLCIARGDTASLPGFDDEVYVQNASFNNQTVQALLENLAIVRQSTIHLLKGVDAESLLQRGDANGSETTARAIACIIAGHELHHRGIIKERYMNSGAYPSV